MRGIAIQGLLAGAAVLSGLGVARAQAIQAGVHDTSTADPASIVTLDVENDAVNGTDRNYSSGLRANYITPTGDIPGFLARTGHVLWGSGLQRLSLGVSQAIYTPSNTQIDPPDPRDRPYAGILTANASLIQDNADYRSVIGIDLGLVGPEALGRQLQNGFHTLIGDTPNRGWHYQIHDEPLVEFTSERTYRVPITSFSGIETDVLPALTVGVGNERVYAQTGAEVRLGQGLTSDYGAARLRPGLTGTDAYMPSQPFVWYVFAGGDVQGVAHDITLDGNSFRNSASVERRGVVGEAQAGIAAVLYGVKASFTEVVQSHEFHDQPGGLFKFGVATLSVRF